ncbi:hypothetical protein VitviT2T_007395 [Vitis vinifera]|uniref:Uncharacterized protein n=1 Tax=Vitis vinifera TaxID=29760 RepID=A0ABY9BYN9_VITVI|nr:hypothetical protein VitviT2T_007395 [Vitis vinifera]
MVNMHYMKYFSIPVYPAVDTSKGSIRSKERSNVAKLMLVVPFIFLPSSSSVDYDSTTATSLPFPLSTTTVFCLSILRLRRKMSRTRKMKVVQQLKQRLGRLGQSPHSCVAVPRRDKGRSAEHCWSFMQISGA